MVETPALKLRFTAKALAELDVVLTEITAASSSGARRVKTRIETIAKLPLQFPKSGQLTTIPMV
jgi:plasmid stabilization system protein ParE